MFEECSNGCSNVFERCSNGLSACLIACSGRPHLGRIILPEAVKWCPCRPAGAIAGSIQPFSDLSRPSRPSIAAPIAYRNVSERIEMHLTRALPPPPEASAETKRAPFPPRAVAFLANYQPLTRETIYPSPPFCAETIYP